MTSYLFPGQGSQIKGMGGTLFEKFSEMTIQADDIPQCCKSRRDSESRRQGCRRSRLLQTLGNAGSGALRISGKVKKMAKIGPILEFTIGVFLFKIFDAL